MWSSNVQLGSELSISSIAVTTLARDFGTPAFILDEELDLTPTEFRLLECLLRSPGRAFSRQHLMDSAIGEGAIVLERTIDVHIKTLRKKLGSMDMIETVRGLGYRFKE